MTHLDIARVCLISNERPFASPRHVLTQLVVSTTLGLELHERQLAVFGLGAVHCRDRSPYRHCLLRLLVLVGEHFRYVLPLDIFADTRWIIKVSHVDSKIMRLLRGNGSFLQLLGHSIDDRRVSLLHYTIL